MKTRCVAAVGMALVLISVAGVEGAPKEGHKLESISFFEHENRGGRNHPMLVDKNCKNLPEDWKGHPSSVVIRNTCVILYAEDDCKGNKAIRLEPNSESPVNLNSVYFNDLTRSQKGC